MAEWKEIREALSRTLEEVKGEKLIPRQEALISGFARELEAEVFDELEKLEGEIKSKGVSSSNPVFRETFKRTLNGFYSIAVSGPGLVEGVALKRLNEVWGHGIEAITGFLERNAKEVGVESWSISSSIGFPSGVSGTVSINFR